MKIEPLISPDAFVGLEGLTHLCTGGESPWMKTHESVLRRFRPLEESGLRRARGGGRPDRGLPGKGGPVVGRPHQPGGLCALGGGGNELAGARSRLECRGHIVTTSLEFPSVGYAWRSLEAEA